jgi:hypothetical protein
MCTNSCPDLHFDHSNLYFNPDIDPGTTGTLQAGGTYTTTVTVRNSGQTATPATISLYVCPPGTNVTFAGAAVLAANIVTVGDVPACSGAVDGTDNGAGVLAPISGSGYFSVSWSPGAYFSSNPGNTVHVCLFAQVRFDGFSGCPAVGYPASTDPSLRGNAQHNIDIADVNFMLLRRRNHRFHFGFGVVNPLREPLEGELVVQAIDPESRALAGMKKVRSIARLLQHGRLRAPRAAQLAFGRERIVAPHVTAEDLRRRLECRQSHALFQLGHTGELEPEVFERLSASAGKPKHAVSLVPGETQQALLELQAPEDARPGDIFAVDIRHETDRHGARQVVGGLIVLCSVTEAKQG